MINILVYLTLIILGYLWLVRNFNYWKNRNVLYLNPVPFFGNAYHTITCKESFSMFLQRIYSRTSEPFFGFFIFNQPYLLVRDPELIKNVLIKDFEYFSDRNILVNKNDKYGSKMLFMLKNPKWKITRNKASTVFSPAKIKNMTNLMINNSKKLIENIELLISNNELVNFRDLCVKYGIDVISSCGFGIEAHSFQNSEFSAVTRKLQGSTFTRNIQTGAHFYAPFFVKLFGFKFIDPKSGQFAEKIFLSEIAKRKSDRQSQGDIIDMLVKMEEAKTYFDDDAIVGLAIQIFLAGFETIGFTMFCILYELCVNDCVQIRLRNEIFNVLSDHENITIDLIRKIDYLDMVIKEGLRKYPSLPFLDRICTKNYKIPNSDVVIEKGTPISISIFGLHHDPKYFPNPEKFDPERFSTENKSDIIPYTYIPFGEGLRHCLGRQFGVAAVSVGIVQILKHFKVELPENSPRELKFKSTGFLMIPDVDSGSLKFTLI